MQEVVQNIKKSKGVSHGMEHWLRQRVTAVANLILVPWFVISLILVAIGFYPSLAHMIKNPANAIVIVLLFMNIFIHGTLGIRVVIEDYMHSKAPRYTLIILTNFLSATAIVVGVFSVLNIYFNFNI